MLAFSTPSSGPPAARQRLELSSDGFDSVAELYLEDDFWQLRQNLHKRRRLKSVIVFKSGVLFRRVARFFNKR